MENTSLLIQRILLELHGIIKGAVQEALQKQEPRLTQKEYNPNKRLSRKQVREDFNICYSSIHAKMNSGELPYEKFGKKTLFKLSDVERIFEKQN